MILSPLTHSVKGARKERRSSSRIVVGTPSIHTRSVTRELLPEVYLLEDKEMPSSVLIRQNRSAKNTFQPKKFNICSHLGTSLKRCMTPCMTCTAGLPQLKCSFSASSPLPEARGVLLQLPNFSQCCRYKTMRLWSIFRNVTLIAHPGSQVGKCQDFTCWSSFHSECLYLYRTG